MARPEVNDYFIPNRTVPEMGEWKKTGCHPQGAALRMSRGKRSNVSLPATGGIQIAWLKQF
jgi:hypothetical protein